MSAKYDEYLQQHRANVAKGARWLHDNIPEIFDYPDATFVSSLDIRFSHDESKLSMSEYSAYDAYFYGEEKTPEVVEEFNKAWLHHIHNNPHHWQHWILINDNPDEGEIILEMPYEYVIEMICDWWAFSWAKNNLHEIFKWHDEHKAYIKLHPNTRKTVESILEKIKKKLEEIEK